MGPQKMALVFFSIGEELAVEQVFGHHFPFTRPQKGPMVWSCVEALLICACVGIHQGWVEPASPFGLSTSRTEALQARRSCASSLETFILSFLHHGPERRVSSLPLSWLPTSSTGLQFVCATGKKLLDQLTFGTSCSMTKPAEPSLHEQCRYSCKAEAEGLLRPNHRQLEANLEPLSGPRPVTRGLGERFQRTHTGAASIYKLYRLRQLNPPRVNVVTTYR